MGVRNQAFARGAIVVALVTVFIFWETALTFISEDVVSRREPSINSLALVDQQGQDLDLDKAANQAEKFSEKAYDGLETTKEIIGKTEARKEAIEDARTKASNKLQDLAERTRQAKESEDTLSETDKRFLRHISE